jgi:putative hydrolase of the HAD superfamily
METNMIQAVIFDWGGVLIENPAEGLTAYCADALGVSRTDITTAFQNYQSDFQKGLIAEPDLWKNLCRDLNVPVPAWPSLYRKAVEHVFIARPEVFGLAKTLREKGYQVGFLSNTEIPAMEYFLDQGHGFFDATIFSCEEHVAKPEAKIYEIACQRLGVEPSEAVFIDDRPDYIQGAQAVGLHTIQYESFEQVTQELRNMGVMW